ncbi:helix-turn-helix domain-containing protein [Marinibaculum pumilum]|uniref:Helix-turn-helix domain-containing protein n=1 Tax=Marinibaculum pumilum TaxID=1766165 RepID=A0ABV7L713_9PROT
MSEDARVARHVAARLRLGRILRDLRQSDLAERVGVLPQQIHKYESGLSRITIERLHALSDALGVPIGFFFEGLHDADGAARAAFSELETMVPEDTSAVETTLLYQEMQDLCRAFSRIPVPEVRQQIISLAKTLSDDLPPPAPKGSGPAEPVHKEEAEAGTS